MGLTPGTVSKALKYDCDKCVAYCCSIYDRVQVTPRDIRRLAGHFRISPEMAIRLSKAFGGSPAVWLKMQMDYGVKWDLGIHARRGGGDVRAQSTNRRK